MMNKYILGYFLKKGDLIKYEGEIRKVAKKLDDVIIIEYAEGWLGTRGWLGNSSFLDPNKRYWAVPIYFKYEKQTSINEIDL